MPEVHNVLSVPGTFPDSAHIRRELSGVAIDIQPADSRTPRVMLAGENPFRGSLSGLDVAELGRHTQLVTWVDTYGAGHVARAYAQLQRGARLAALGGTCVSSQGSAICWSESGWRRLAEAAEIHWNALRGASAEAASPALHGILVAAFVQLPLREDDGVWYSCGMHLLGQPDVEMEIAGADQAFGPGADAMTASTLETMCRYMLDVQGQRTLTEGQTFAMASDAPRFRLARRACRRHPPGDLYHNPQGYWRLQYVA